jgi:3-phosphoglycerate kinase
MSTKLKSLIQQIIKEEAALLEKKKKKDELPPLDVDVDIDAEATEAPAEEAPIEDVPTDPNMDMGADIGGDSIEKQVGQGLQTALDAAKQLPDGENKDKLVRQIGNTALFFLKTQITKDQA